MRRLPFIFFLIGALSMLSSCQDSGKEILCEPCQTAVIDKWNIPPDQIKVYESGKAITMKLQNLTSDLFDGYVMFRSQGETRRLAFACSDHIPGFDQKKHFILELEGPTSAQHKSIEIAIPDMSQDVTKALDVDKLRPLMGLSLDDPQVKTATQHLAAPVKEITDWEYHQGGFSFEFSSDNKITNVMCYNRGIDGFNQFAGKLLNGLSWEDSQAQVEAKLGPPTKRGAQNKRHLHEEDGLVIIYDVNGKMETIIYTLPK